MALINWEDQMSVGVTQFDSAHKKLIDLINELHDAMLNKQSKETLSKVVGELALYTKNHFADEEEQFKKLNYPNTDNHIKLHKTFVDKVYEFQKGIDSGKLFLSIEVTNFLKDWLIGHIQGVDKKYQTFFNERGIS